MVASNQRSTLRIGFQETVLERGGDPNRILKLAGLTVQDLEEPELLKDSNEFVRLLNIAAAETGSEFFGLELSLHLDLSIMGTLGLLVQHATTVEEALNIHIRYSPILSLRNVPSLKVEGELAILSGHNVSRSEGARQILYLGTGLLMTMMKALLGEDWIPLEMHSTFDLPKLADRMFDLLGVRVKIGQERNQVIFNASDLNRKLSRSFGQLNKYLQAQLDELEKQVEGDILTRTEYLIRVLLPDGACSFENISSLLSTGEKTLQRRLRARGTSFRQLVETVRQSMARQYLRQPDLSMSQLAYKLGYTELSTFTHAFKRWFGVAPSKWRNQSP